MVTMKRISRVAAALSLAAGMAGAAIPHAAAAATGGDLFRMAAVMSPPYFDWNVFPLGAWSGSVTFSASGTWGNCGIVDGDHDGDTGGCNGLTGSATYTQSACLTGTVRGTVWTTYTATGVQDVFTFTATFVGGQGVISGTEQVVPNGSGTASSTKPFRGVVDLQLAGDRSTSGCSTSFTFQTAGES